MPATDQATLLAGPNIACYNNLGMQDQQLIKLALLQIIAKSLNPVAATDQASLLSSPNIACYRSVGSYPLLELALLQIIANGIGSGGGGYTLPIASTTTLGGIKPDGTTITVNASTGVASAAGGTATSNVVSGSGANPNNVGGFILVPPIPTSGAVYTQDPSIGTGSNVWLWSVANQNWVQFSV